MAETAILEPQAPSDLGDYAQFVSPTPEPAPTATPPPTPDLGDYAQFLSPTPSPSPGLGDYAQFVSPTPASYNAVAETQQIADTLQAETNQMFLPRMGTMGVESKLMGLDANQEQPEWFKNAQAALGETALGFIPKSPEEVAAMLSPPVQAMEIEKQYVNTVKDWLGGKPINRAVIDNDATLSMFDEADQTPDFSKERFKVAFTVLAQLGMMYGARSLIRGGKPNAKQVTETAQPDGLRTEPVMPGETQPPAAGQGGEGVPLGGQGPPLGEGTTSPLDLVPALRTESGIIPGAKGQTHQDIYNAQPDPIALRAADPEHGFVTVEQPQNFLPRARGAEMLGETEPLQSERLIELQKAAEPPPAAELGGAGAAASEEFMKRYATVGARSILDNGLDPAKFQQAIETAFGPHLRPLIPDIFERAKALLNEFPTATALDNLIKMTRARETPVLVRPFVAQKAALLEAERAGKAGFRRGKAEATAEAKAVAAEARQKHAQLLRDARAEGKAAAQQIKDDLMQSDRFMAGDQEQVRQNMIEYAKAVLPVAERGRFLNAITKAMARPRIGTAPDIMYRHAFNVMKAIDARAEVLYKKGLIEEIKDVFDRSLESKTVDVAYRRKLQEVYDSILTSKPSQQTLNRLQSMKDFVERERAAGREPQISPDELAQLETLSRLPLTDMPANALEALRDQIVDTVKLGKLKTKLLERQWEAIRQRSIEALSKVEADPIARRPIFRAQPTERLTFWQKFSNVVNRTMNAKTTAGEMIAPMDEIYDHLGGSKGTYDTWPSRHVKGEIDLAWNKVLVDFSPIATEARSIIKRFNLDSLDMEAVGLKQVMTNIGRERLEAMQIRKDILDKIESTPLTPGQQAYFDFARKIYNADGPRVSDVAHRLYQEDMSLDPDYVPLQRDWDIFAEGKAPEGTADVVSGEIPFNEKATMDQLRRDFNPKKISKTEQGFLKDRIEGAKTAVKLNAHDILMRHHMDAMHFVHSQPVIKMLGEIVRSPEFAAKFGVEGQQIVLDNLDSVATQGAVNPMRRVRILDWIRNSTSKGAVGFRIASNIVHESQLPIAFLQAGDPVGLWFGKGFQHLITKEGQAFLQKNYAESFARSGGEPAQADVEAVSGKFGRAGFFVARNLDRINAQATFLGRYAKEMHERRGIPLDQVFEVPVDKDIQALAIARSHRAVASPFAKDIPQITSRGKGIGNVSVARVISQFRNIFYDKYSVLRHDFLRVGMHDLEDVVKLMREGEIKAGVKKLSSSGAYRTAIGATWLLSVAMETAIKTYIPLGIRAGINELTGQEPTKSDKEKSFLHEFQHHFINSFPYVGQLAAAFMYGDTGIPVIDSIVKPVHEMGIAAKSKKPETVLKHEVRALSGVTTLFGIPGSSQALDILEAFLSRPEPTGGTATIKPPKVSGIVKDKKPKR